MKRAVQVLIDSRILGRALMVGVILEVALMLASHFRPLLQVHYALFGIMMIAARQHSSMPAIWPAAMAWARWAGW
jgi:hypothetical protein